MARKTTVKSLESIVDNSNELQMLKALRHKLAHTIDSTTSARDIAPLSKQLREVIARIAELQHEPTDGAGLDILDFIVMSERLNLDDPKEKRIFDLLEECQSILCDEVKHVG